MRVDLTFLERAYFANLCRRRSVELATLRDKRSLASARQEFAQEIEFVEALAKRFDDGEVSEKLGPHIVTSNVDVDYLDRDGAKR